MFIFIVMIHFLSVILLGQGITFVFFCFLNIFITFNFFSGVTQYSKNKIKPYSLVAIKRYKLKFSLLQSNTKYSFQFKCFFQNQYEGNLNIKKIISFLIKNNT